MTMENDLVERLLKVVDLLAAEDARQSKIHDLLETIREQIRLEVKPECRPDELFTNIQNAVYAMRGRTRLLDDIAIVAPPTEAASRIQDLEADNDRLHLSLETAIQMSLTASETAFEQKARAELAEAELARKTEALKWVLTKIETGRDRSGSGYYDVAFHDNDLSAARSALEEKTDV